MHEPKQHQSDRIYIRYFCTYFGHRNVPYIFDQTHTSVKSNYPQRKTTGHRWSVSFSEADDRSSPAVGRQAPATAGWVAVARRQRCMRSPRLPVCDKLQAKARRPQNAWWGLPKLSADGLLTCPSYVFCCMLSAFLVSHRCVRRLSSVA